VVVPEQELVVELDHIARIGLGQLDRLQVVRELLLHPADRQAARLLLRDELLDPGLCRPHGSAWRCHGPARS
jgi:hypothetical protein